MPPEDRFVCRFAAEPPQDPLPYGRWAETLQAEFIAACLKIDAEGEDLGEAGELAYYPDRTWSGRTYVPVTARSTTGFELYGYVSFWPGNEHDEPSDFYGWADFTDVTADDHPEWRMDLTEEVVGGSPGSPSTNASSPTSASRCWRPTPTARTTSRWRSTTARATSSHGSRSTRTTAR